MERWVDVECRMLFDKEPDSYLISRLNDLLDGSYSSEVKMYETKGYIDFDKVDIYEVFELTHGFLKKGRIDCYERANHWAYIYVARKGAWKERELKS